MSLKMLWLLSYRTVAHDFFLDIPVICLLQGSVYTHPGRVRPPGFIHSPGSFMMATILYVELNIKNYRHFELGEDIKAVSNYLGHSTSAITMDMYVDSKITPEKAMIV